MLKRQKTYLNETAKVYLIGTPIGNYNDITYRAVETLRFVDEIYCEDTRVTGLLLSHFNIKTKLHSYHIYNENELTEQIINKVLNGLNIGVVSDAGMPSISDPGFLVAKACVENDVDLCVVPGVSASITSLVGSGIPCNQFTFIGFLNNKENKKREELLKLSKKDETIILYEAPHRILETLALINEIMPKRYICLCRELTKKYEEYLHGTAQEILEVVDELKGEMVIIISGCSHEEKVEKLNELAIAEHYLYYINLGIAEKDAMKKVASDRNVSKSEIYKIIKIKKNSTMS